MPILVNKHGAIGSFSGRQRVNERVYLYRHAINGYVLASCLVLVLPAQQGKAMDCIVM
jgi:hypothetical protein